jgi:hypothetical protein
MVFVPTFWFRRVKLADNEPRFRTVGYPERGEAVRRDYRSRPYIYFVSYELTNNDEYRTFVVNGFVASSTPVMSRRDVVDLQAWIGREEVRAKQIDSAGCVLLGWQLLME